MWSRLAPPRRHDPEYLDAPSVDDSLVLRSVSDIVRSNQLFGGRRAVLQELRAIFPSLPPHATLLDVGTGLGDIPRAVSRAAGAQGIALQTFGLDGKFALARAVAHGIPGHHPRRHKISVLSVCGSAIQLPFADRSIDITMCSQLLHHFRDDAARTLLRELNRVARRAVVVSDLRRSWLAAAGFWAASFPLRFHSVTRHDGTVSVMRGFTVDELGDTIAEAVGVQPVVHRRLGFRVTTSWTPV